MGEGDSGSMADTGVTAATEPGRGRPQLRLEPTLLTGWGQCQVRLEEASTAVLQWGTFLWLALARVTKEDRLVVRLFFSQKG